MTECNVCSYVMTFSHRSHYHLILDGEGEEAKFYDFCSFRCLKEWIG